MLEFQQDNQFFLFFHGKPTRARHFLNRLLGKTTTDYRFSQRTWHNLLPKYKKIFVNRHYYRGGLWGENSTKIAIVSIIAETRSVAEFQPQLHQAGVAVPKPIAARVKKRQIRICYQADILIEKIENAQDLTALLQTQQLPNDILSVN